MNAMKRAIVAFLAGLLTWIVVVSLLDRGLRLAIPGYAAVEPQMSFTLGMMAARLAIAAVTSLIAGAVTGRIAGAGSRMGWILGLILFALFIPVHVRLWHSFPVWYHLTFLGTLAPLIALGSRLGQGHSTGKPAGGGTDPGGVLASR